MKKRFICLVLSLCMVVGVVTGCGSSKDALSDNAITSKESEDTSSNNVVTSKESEDASSDNVSVTQKLEEEYVERMEAYLAYYQEQDTTFTRIGVNVTLDNDHLPLMWLRNEIDYEYYNVQLVGYEDGEAKILAEKAIDAEAICPIYTSYAVVAYIIDGDSEDYDFIVYDDDIKDFRYTSEEELVENYGINIIQDLDPEELNSRNYIIYTNSAKNEIAYIGYTDSDFSDYSSYSGYDGELVPFTIYDYNNEVFQSFDEGKYFIPGGNSLYSFYRSYTISKPEIAEALLRYLISHPAYTNGTLVTSTYAIGDYTVVDASTLDIDMNSLFEIRED